MKNERDVEPTCDECERLESDCRCEIICSGCNGSGEGRFDGTRCQSCGGSGVQRQPTERDPDRDREDWQERQAEEARERRIFGDD